MSTTFASDEYPQTHSLPKQKKSEMIKFHGFDFLRAIFSVFIVALHVELFKPFRTIGLGTLDNIFNANFVYLAVPVFLQISLLLFYVKIHASKEGDYFLKKRLPRLIYLYLFWVVSLLIFNIIFGFNGGLEGVFSSIFSPRGVIEFMVSGGNTPLYFFFSLIFLSVLCWIYSSLLSRVKSFRLRDVLNYSLLGLSCLLLAAFFGLSLMSGSDNRIVGFLSNFAKWNFNPLNFLPYVFISAIAANDVAEGRLKAKKSLKVFLSILLALFLILTVAEWFISHDLLHYSRPSLVLGSWLLLYLGLLSTQKVPPVIRFLSDCSLGIYTLHLFFTHGFFSKSLMDSPIFIVQLLEALVKFSIALFGSIALTVAFKRNRFLKNFV